MLHCHTNDGETYEIFTVSDLLGFCNLADNSTLPQSELGIYLATKSGKIYALKITNRIKFVDQGLNLFINKEFLEKEFDRYVKKDDSSDKQLKGFLKFLSSAFGEEGLHIELYEQDALNEWSRVKLNSFLNVKKSKCD